MRLRFVAIVAVVGGVGLPAVAVANPYEVKKLQVISGPSPFAAGCPGAALDETRIAGAEIEPAITVNPAHPRNIVATWQQDVGRGAARSDLIGTSRDGGKTWKRVTIPGLSRCTGGSADVATDPWLSAGPDGSVYFSGAAIFLTSDPPPAVLVASRSHDRGRRWSAPVTFAGPSVRVEREVVTADPTRPGHAYVVWWERDALMPFVGSTHQFARTTDGGATWSAPATLDTAPSGALDQSAEILVLPNGALLALIARLQLEGAGAVQQLFAVRSQDQGRNWSLPVQVASQPVAPIPDPETGDALPNQDLTFHSAAIAPDGTVYVAWDRDSTATTGTIDIVKSSDGGRSWAPRHRFPASPPSRSSRRSPSIGVARSESSGTTTATIVSVTPRGRPMSGLRTPPTAVARGARLTSPDHSTSGPHRGPPATSDSASTRGWRG